MLALVPSLVDDLVDGGLLVSGSRHDVLVVGRDVAAQDGGRLLGLGKAKPATVSQRPGTASFQVLPRRPYLEYAGAVGSPPGVQQVVFARAHKPFTCKRRFRQRCSLRDDCAPSVGTQQPLIPDRSPKTLRKELLMPIKLP